MLAVLIIGLIILIISFILFYLDKYHPAYVTGLIGAYIVSGAIIFLKEGKRPSAIDVYRGKTTLEITYKDDVPVDSVVVFK